MHLRLLLLRTCLEYQMTKWKLFNTHNTLRFIDFINRLSRRQLAFLSTFFSLGFLVLLLLNFHLYPPINRADKGVEILIEMELEKELIEKKEVLAAISKGESFETNTSFNTEMKATYIPNNQSPTPSSLVESTQNGDGNSSFEEKLNKLAKEKKQAIDSLNTTKSKINNIPSKTRVYYSLFERDQVQLPIPVYTCKEGGKVVINIKVDPEGRVLDTQVNTVQSTTSNGCLLENALNYAAKSSFNISSGKMQWGTITYYFQAKVY
jgi:hypothetical protein